MKLHQIISKPSCSSPEAA